MEISYDEFIVNILNTRGRNGCGEEYHETHHIVPKCMGGSNDKENLIDLFAREHFEAHRLLALENPENDSLIYAWACMAWVKDNNQQRTKITPEEYEEVKKRYSEMASRRYSGKNNPCYGRKHTDEEKKKMSKNHGKYFGESNHYYGKHHSEEIRKKMSDNSKTKKKVICLETGEVFDSLTKAADFAGVSKSAIMRACKGMCKSSGGYHWEYYEKQEVSA